MNKEYSLYFKNPEERARKISLCKKGKPSPLKGRTYEEIHGKEKAKELRLEKAENAHRQKGKPKPGVSKALKGRIFPHMYIKNVPSHRKGLSIIDEYGEKRAREIEEKKLNARIKNKTTFKGEYNPNWQGGISYEPYSQLFNQQLKDKIRVRDNFICQICGIPELECDKRLHIHHINYNKKNSEMDNLISLCPKCHTKTNHKREYWEGYFKRINNEAQDSHHSP